MSSLANLRTCRLYRGSLALAEAESSSGRRPVALLEHLDRTDLKASVFQASNVIRIHSRNADLIVGWLCAKIRKLYHFGIFSLINLNRRRFYSKRWTWMAMENCPRESFVFKALWRRGQPRYIPLESLMMLVVSRQITTNATSYLKESEKKSHTRTCHGQEKIPTVLDTNAYVYGYSSSYHGRTGGLTAKEAQRLLRIWDQAG